MIGPHPFDNSCAAQSIKKVSRRVAEDAVKRKRAEGKGRTSASDLNDWLAGQLNYGRVIRHCDRARALGVGKPIESLSWKNRFDG